MRKTDDREPLSLKKNMLFNTIGNLTFQGCLWLITVLVVLLSDSYSDSGVLSFAITVGNMFTAISTYSLRSYQVSDIANEYSHRNYIAFRVVTILVGYAIIVPYAFVVSTDFFTLTSVLLYMIFIMDQSFIDVLFGIEQREGRMDYIGISQFIRGILVVASFSAGFGLLHDLRIAIVFMFVTGLCMTLLYDIPHARRYSPKRPAIHASQVKTLLLTCLPIVLATLFGNMVVSVARQYYGNIFGMESLGLYAAVATPAVLIQAAARLLYAPALVPLAERWNDSPQDEFPKYLRKTFLAIVGAGIAMIVIFSLVGTPLLAIVYGSSIEPYVYLFPWILVTTALVAILWFCTDVLTICRDLKGLLIANAGALAVTLITMVPLENNFGMDGINAVIIVSLCAGILISLFLIVRVIRTKNSRS